MKRSVNRFIYRILLFAAVCLLPIAVPQRVSAAAIPKPAVPVMKGTADKNVVTLTWNQVKNASGYRIYLYYKSQNKFKTVCILNSGTKTSLSLTGSRDRIYRYKIRSFTKKNKEIRYSNLSDEIQVKTAPGRTNITSLARTSGSSAVIQWEKMPYAHGYQIFRGTSEDGPYKKIQTIVGNDIDSYTDTGLTRNEAYYYRIRAYAKNFGTPAYGILSMTACAPVRPIMVIGDSRTVFLQEYCGDSGLIWICKSGMGYSWLETTAVKEVQAQMRGNDDIYIWLGVNDVHNVSQYISFLNEKTAEWKKNGVNVYVLAVGPVENDPYTTNEEIEEFNRLMKAGIKGVKYLDLYSYLKKEGFSTIDGIHYDYNTCMKVFQYILKMCS